MPCLYSQNRNDVVFQSLIPVQHRPPRVHVHFPLPQQAFIIPPSRRVAKKLGYEDRDGMSDGCAHSIQIDTSSLLLGWYGINGRIWIE